MVLITCPGCDNEVLLADMTWEDRTRNGRDHRDGRCEECGATICEVCNSRRIDGINPPDVVGSSNPPRMRSRPTREQKLITPNYPF